MNATSLQKNPFDYLRLDELCDEPLSESFIASSVTITTDPSESVTSLAARLPSGRWCYGYTVCWANGRISHLYPDPSKGVFATEREARLYLLGFLLVYLNSFTPETQAAIQTAVAETSQAELF